MLGFFMAARIASGNGLLLFLSSSMTFSVGSMKQRQGSSTSRWTGTEEQLLTLFTSSNRAAYLAESLLSRMPT
jgi:hypothetical protein